MNRFSMVQIAVRVTAITVWAWSGTAWAGNVAERAVVHASSTRGDADVQRAVDGLISDGSRWLSDGDANPWIVFEFDTPATLTAADLYSGYEYGSPVLTFRFQAWTNVGWVDIPGGRIVDNDQLAIRALFLEPVRASAVRLWIENPGALNVARVREVRLWTDDPDDLGELVQIERPSFNPTFDTTQHLIFLNQSGFNSNWPKRFTAPVSPDGSTFTVTPLTDNRVLFTGTINGHVGDFTGFTPDDPMLQYVVHVDGGGLSPGSSDPFFVAPFFFQSITLEPALRFFVDDRSATGSWPGAFGCAPWRDSPFYAYSTASLVNLYLSNPSCFEQMNVEMDWERDMQRVLSPDFVLDRGAEENAMEVLARMYEELDGPVGEDVPDIIQLIHWGVSWWYIDPVSKDWAGTEERLHPETVTIPAFFLYGYPHFAEYFTDRYYERIRDWTFANWEASGLYEVQTRIGTFKGRYPPGWTVLPNLMMYEVALREGRADASLFLDAAVAQAQWIVEEVDLRDPLNTKGQRMSEHKTISGLVTLLTHYPEAAPARLEAYLRLWADVAISRSDNRWDFRRYDSRHWSLPRQMPGHTGGGSSWNEPGNLAGFPFLAWSVSSVLGDAPGDTERIDRLNVLAVSHFDNLWGRNPLGFHTGWRGPADYLGVERGWPIKYRPVCAHLYSARGAICSSAATEHYPFNPGGAFRHPEGWTAFNAAFNMGLIAATRQDTRLSVQDRNGNAWDGGPGSVILQLDAPVLGNTAEITVTTSAGDSEVFTLHRSNYRLTSYRNSAIVEHSSARGGDGVIQLMPDDQIVLQYGYGYFASTARIQPASD